MSAGPVLTPHPIGDGSSYDADLSMVTNFVIAYHQPADFETQKRVQTYYVDRIRSYWQQLVEYLFGTTGQPPGVEADLPNPDIFSSNYEVNAADELILLTAVQAVEMIRRDFPQSEAKHRHQLELLEADFAARRRINLVLINLIFQDMGVLFCLSLSPEIYKTKANEFPLPNGSGLFGLNTWLYAYFSGIFLLGIPNKPQEYDLNYSCTGIFVEHDARHDKNIIIADAKRRELGLAPLQAYQREYLKILNYASLTTIQKEMCIMTLWCIIHEFVIQNPACDLAATPLIWLRTLLNDEMEALVIDFNPEYRRFSSLTLSSPYLPGLVAAFKAVGLYALEENSVYDLASAVGASHGFSMVGIDVDLEIFPVEDGDIYQRLLGALQGGLNDPSPVVNDISLYLMTHWVARAMINAL